MIGDRWGVSEAEVRRAYGCDAFVARPTLEAWCVDRQPWVALPGMEVSLDRE